MVSELFEINSSTCNCRRILLKLLFPCKSYRLIRLKCDFYEDKFFGYTCVLDGIKLSSRRNAIMIDTTLNERLNIEVEAVIIKNSQISFLPNRLFQVFPNIKRFYANENNSDLKELRPNDLQGARNLIGLNLDNNEISKLSTNNFKEAPNLVNLLLSKNPIKVIEDFSFLGLEKLVLLELSDILIKVITRNTFAGLRELKFLFLENHYIRIVEKGAFENNGNLTKLHAEDIGILQRTYCLEDLEDLEDSENQEEIKEKEDPLLPGYFLVHV